METRAELNINQEIKKFVSDEVKKLHAKDADKNLKKEASFTYFGITYPISTGYISTKEQETTTVGEKKILDHLMHYEIKKLTDVVFDALGEMQKKITAKKNDKLFKAINSSIETFRNITGNSEKDLKILNAFFIQEEKNKEKTVTKISETWQLLLNEFENLSKHGSQSLQIEHQECSMLLKGFTLNVGLRYRAHEIKKLLESGDEKMKVNYPAKSRIFAALPQVSENTKNALDFIAKLSPDETLPLILWHLEVLLQDQEKNNASTETLEIIKLALKNLSEAEQRQRLSITHLLMHPFEARNIFTELTHEKITSSLNKLVADTILMALKTENVKERVIELGLLFAGLHSNIYNQAPKNNNDEVNYNQNINAKDKFFHEYTQLHMIDIADYYLMIAVALLEKVMPEFKSLTPTNFYPQGIKKIVADHQAKMEASQIILPVITDNINNNNNINNNINNNAVPLVNESSNVDGNVNKENPSEVTRIIDAVENENENENNNSSNRNVKRISLEKEQPNKIITAEDIPSLFQTEISDDEKINALQQLYNLSVSDGLIFHSFFDKICGLISEQATEIINNKYLNKEIRLESLFHLPDYVYRFRGRAHSTMAKELLKNLSEAKTLKKQLELLFAAKKDLNIKASIDLQAAIKDVIVAIFNDLQNAYKFQNLDLKNLGLNTSSTLFSHPVPTTSNGAIANQANNKNSL